MFYAVVIGLLIGMDQVVKYLVRAQIPLGDQIPFLPGILALTHVQNTGAAFSLLASHTWLLILLSSVVILVLLVLLARRTLTRPMGLWAVCLVLAGAIGNLIDRLLFGSVTDMFQFLFIRFAVFNVADTCVVIGGILLGIYLLFFWETHKGKKISHETSDH